MSAKSPTITISVPLAALLDYVAKLKPTAKRKIWQALNEQIEQEEEEKLQKLPTVRKQIAEARKAYRNGDYVTIEEMLRRNNIA